MSLIELIKNNLREEDKKLVENIDFNKADEENITTLVELGFLDFKNHEN